MMIKILFSLISLGSLITLAEKFRLLLINKFSDNPMINSVLNHLGNSMHSANKALNDAKKNPLTKTVKEADTARGDLYISLRDHVTAGIRRRNKDYRDACLELYPILEQNNLRLHYLGYDEETAAIKSLVTDLDNEKARAHLSTIHALELMHELDDANNDFVATTKNRSKKRVDDNIPTNMVAFQQLKGSLGLVCSALDAMLAMNQPEGIQETVAVGNQYIKEAHAAARQSVKKPRSNQDEKTQA
jgi:hypothetical protein